MEPLALIESLCRQRCFLEVENWYCRSATQGKYVWTLSAFTNILQCLGVGEGARWIFTAWCLKITLQQLESWAQEKVLILSIRGSAIDVSKTITRCCVGLCRTTLSYLMHYTYQCICIKVCALRNHHLCWGVKQIHMLQQTEQSNRNKYLQCARVARLLSTYPIHMTMTKRLLNISCH